MLKSMGQLKSAIHDFDLNDLEPYKRVELRPLTIWIPVPEKDKYDELQRITKQKFGKHLKALVVTAIDKMKVPAK